jgi:hypothetical protein
MRLLFLVLTVVLLCKCRVWQYAFAAATFQADAHDESRLGSEKYPVISFKKISYLLGATHRACSFGRWLMADIGLFYKLIIDG